MTNESEIDKFIERAEKSVNKHSERAGPEFVALAEVFIELARAIQADLEVIKQERPVRIIRVPEKTEGKDG